MKKMTSAEIRSAFLDYFEEMNHQSVSSAPLPQPDNPTLLFTNAGMNQFADVFLGKENRSYRRATSSQKCMRVSGKHNDLENVGPSPRHHTFFEMLGNFSFGDYFKKEAIAYAWSFITEVLELDKNRLWVTIFDDDDEAGVFWQSHVDAERILRFGEDDNYWRMGDVGPCGPCSEIFYYLGDLDTMDSTQLNAEDDQLFLEIWNLVFMQFNEAADGTKTPLPNPSIDTGMGLERLARVLQGAETNYETDLFIPALDKVQQLLDDSDEERAEKYVGYRVIADHGRAATFMIADGVVPGANGPSYVLRMVIRRAARFGRKIGFEQPFLAEIAQIYIDQMGDVYPELVARKDAILSTISAEESRFALTLDRALSHLETTFETMAADGHTEIAGQIAFDLHATRGLPLEITRDIAQERGYSIDMAGFEAAREAHAKASGGALGSYDQAAGPYARMAAQLLELGWLGTAGVGHKPYGAPTLRSTVVGLLVDDVSAETAIKDQSLELITGETPFYAESGGEVGDSGFIRTSSGVMRVETTKRPKNAPKLVLHRGTVVEGFITVGEVADLEVDDACRDDIRRNHTATHVLHRELRAHLGTHVAQAGSLVAADRLRFDFQHPESVTAAQLAQIEADVNAAVLANYSVSAETMTKDAALKRGAMALFGEKYGDEVRTVQIGDGGDYSMELCGGLHVSRTGDIGPFVFTSEGSVSSGIRRVEALTGKGAQAFLAARMGLLAVVERKIGVSAEQLPDRLDALINENKALKKELEGLRGLAIQSSFDEMLANAPLIGEATVLVGKFEGADSDSLRQMADRFRNKRQSGVAVMATVVDERPRFIATVTKDLIKRGIRAGDLVREAGKRTGGGGGGRPNLAEAGGRDASKLAEVLDALEKIVAGKLVK